ncbi:hypothetical protein [Paraburkholderia sp. BR14320]|uniref:hypothetical protein n=1 Tax=unclassified Paraburkholderia TaxID=2615204 RepID=UPI0034CD8D5A
MPDQTDSEALTISNQTASESALRQVATSRLFRGSTLAMFLSGLGTSAAAPQIVLFLVKELGASLPLAGLSSFSSCPSASGWVAGSATCG